MHTKIETRAAQKPPEPLVWESVPANDPLWEADVVPLPLPVAPIPSEETEDMAHATCFRDLRGG